MYPNPQQALPLPTRPNVEQYKKLAKDLVKACKSGEPAADSRVGRSLDREARRTSGRAQIAAAKRERDQRTRRPRRAVRAEDTLAR